MPARVDEGWSAGRKTAQPARAKRLRMELLQTKGELEREPGRLLLHFPAFESGGCHLTRAGGTRSASFATTGDSEY
jgi:hypothetical protein